MDKLIKNKKKLDKETAVLFDVFIQYLDMDTRYGTYGEQLEPCITEIIREYGKFRPHKIAAHWRLLQFLRPVCRYSLLRSLPLLRYFQEDQLRVFSIVMLVYDKEAQADLEAIVSSIQITK